MQMCECIYGVKVQVFQERLPTVWTWKVVLRHEDETEMVMLLCYIQFGNAFSEIIEKLSINFLCTLPTLLGS